MGKAIDSTLVEGSKACNKCGKAKPLEAFPINRRSRDGRNVWCKACMRVNQAQYRQTPAYREAITKYLARPEVKERRKEYQLRREQTPRRQAWKAAYTQTTRCKLQHSRVEARQRLKRATTDKRRQELLALIASYDRELDRIKNQ
ncbi:hypothetical protein SH661x_001925 [Planctomicrobium sp. SH661]|uniref:hypothetical protein n=1 Tax=Planctomicrobium sp. SH661 TaxID=3448124 RepID=UPI003F5C7AAF